MGTQFITSWPRQILYLEVNGQGAGTHRLTARGNHVPDTVYRLAFEDKGGLRFAVVQAGEVKPKKDRTRDTATLDRNLVMARWIVANCDGVGRNKAAEKLAAEFGSSAETCKKYISSAKIPVVQSGTGWRLTDAAEERLTPPAE